MGEITGNGTKCLRVIQDEVQQFQCLNESLSRGFLCNEVHEREGSASASIFQKNSSIQAIDIISALCVIFLDKIIPSINEILIRHLSDTS